MLSILPIALTYWVSSKIFSYFSKPGSKIVEYIFNKNAPPYISELTGFFLTIIFIYFIGIFISNILGKKIFSWIENVLFRLPVISTVYKTIKQITSTLSKSDTEAFKKVVIVEYPRKGLWTLSMVTGQSKSIEGKEYYHIFIPTTPNPTSGYFLYVLKEDAYEIDISIEEGMKIIISAGMLASKNNLIPKSIDISE